MYVVNEGGVVSDFKIGGKVVFHRVFSSSSSSYPSFSTSFPSLPFQSLFLPPSLLPTSCQCTFASLSIPLLMIRILRVLLLPSPPPPPPPPVPPHQGGCLKGKGGEESGCSLQRVRILSPSSFHPHFKFLFSSSSIVPVSVVFISALSLSPFFSFFWCRLFFALFI